MNSFPTKKKKKKKKRPCTEWLCSPYPTCFALFAVADDEGRLCRFSRTYLALRSGRRRNLTAVLTKICKEMPFLKLQQQLRSSRKTPFRPLGCRIWTVGTVRRQLRATKSALALVCDTERSLDASFARALHHVVRSPSFWWPLLLLETLSACSAGKEMVLQALFAFWLCSLHKDFPVQFSVDVRELAVQCV